MFITRSSYPREYVGAGMPAGLRALRERLSTVKRDQVIVIHVIHLLLSPGSDAKYPGTDLCVGDQR